MTREETKKAIEVMQAYVDGETVGCMRHDGNGILYYSESESPAWDWFHSNYVIKPQPMKVTEEERIYLRDYLPIPILDKKLGKIYFYPRYCINTLNANRYYILNPDTMEWEDWSEDTDKLKHHYNGGQP